MQKAPQEATPDGVPERAYGADGRDFGGYACSGAHDDAASDAGEGRRAEAGELLGLQRLYVTTALTNQPRGELSKPPEVRSPIRMRLCAVVSVQCCPAERCLTRLLW